MAVLCHFSNVIKLLLDVFLSLIGQEPPDYFQGDGPRSQKVPFEKIFATAQLATMLDPKATPALVALIDDNDSAARYWATLGLLMRGSETVIAHVNTLRKALGDDSAYVRVDWARSSAALQFIPLTLSAI
jgi:hypothetical protein